MTVVETQQDLVRALHAGELDSQLFAFVDSEVRAWLLVELSEHRYGVARSDPIDECLARALDLLVATWGVSHYIPALQIACASISDMLARRAWRAKV